ncbi:hypothetical protein ACFU5Z_19535 [Streptomyces sp. NPDC057521]|uniref:hypothetical protein n=1 Tax=Streptomyces sp. NPDC057521 TaxID=3346156 RepID=UPI00367CB6BD
MLGDVGWQFSVHKSDSAALLVVDLAAEPGDTELAVEVLTATDTRTSQVSVISAEGAHLAVHQLPEAMASWSGGSIEPAFREALRQLGDPRIEVDTLAPLLLLRLHAGTDALRLEALMASRLRKAGALFTRVATLAYDGAEPIGAIAIGALTYPHGLTDSVSTETQVYTGFERGTEIEVKLTVQDDTPVWALASAMYQKLEQGGMPGFVADLGNEMQRWQFTMHMYEVLAPEASIGYISFSPKPSGKFVVHQKMFREDALRRQESSRYDVEIPGGDFDAYLAMDYPELVVRRMPSYRRSRFDVNIESALTGHFFGIEIDEVTELSSGKTLRQVEIEYHHSRVHQGLSPSTIEVEMERLIAVVRRELADRGVAVERSFYSKLSFLKDCEKSAALPT